MTTETTREIKKRIVYYALGEYYYSIDRIGDEIRIIIHWHDIDLDESSSFIICLNIDEYREAIEKAKSGQKTLIDKSDQKAAIEITSSSEGIKFSITMHRYENHYDNADFTYKWVEQLLMISPSNYREIASTKSSQFQSYDELYRDNDKVIYHEHWVFPEDEEVEDYNFEMTISEYLKALEDLKTQERVVFTRKDQSLEFVKESEKVKISFRDWSSRISISSGMSVPNIEVLYLID